jgi:hypothetical protein
MALVITGHPVHEERLQDEQLVHAQKEFQLLQTEGHGFRAIWRKASSEGKVVLLPILLLVWLLLARRWSVLSIKGRRGLNDAW